MDINDSSFAFGAVGLAVGTGVQFWARKRELEQRCEFMGYIKRDISEAFDTTDVVLSSQNTPAPIRSALLHLLAAHAKPSIGKGFAAAFIERMAEDDDESVVDGTDPISLAMAELAKTDSGLARKTHHALASLSFGLVFLNMADSMTIEKVQDQAARDPVSLWARISRLFGTDGDNGAKPGGRLVTA